MRDFEQVELDIQWRDVLKLISKNFGEVDDLVECDRGLKYGEELANELP